MGLASFGYQKDPRNGLVGASRKVHGLTTLFVGGILVFPTVGSDAPTLTNSALAIRLADEKVRPLCNNAARPAQSPALRPVAASCKPARIHETVSMSAGTLSNY